MLPSSQELRCHHGEVGRRRILIESRRYSRRQCPTNGLSKTLFVLCLASSSFSNSRSIVYAQEECPPEVNGWAAAPDCRSYYWCSNGARSSIIYNCVDNTEFNVKSSSCETPGNFACEGALTGSTSAAVEAQSTSVVDQSESTSVVEQSTPVIDWASNGVSLSDQVKPTTTVAAIESEISQKINTSSVESSTAMNVAPVAANENATSANATTAQVNEVIIPTNETAPLAAESIIPANVTVSSSTETVNLANGTATSSTETTISVHETVIPSTQPSVATNQVTIPATEAAIPATIAAIPATLAAIPATLAAIPATTAAVQSSANSVSNSTPTVPSTVTDNDINAAMISSIDEVNTNPTLYPTKLGPPRYYGDFRTSTCISAAPDPQGDAGAAPEWITEEVMFQSKEECCMEMFGWAPLENCLGTGWIETNYIRGSKAPTASPSDMPSFGPSAMPSLSFFPTIAPSMIPSKYPSIMPSINPSALPSSLPSEVPSSFPSIEPTSLLTTIAPSVVPTASPTVNPTMNPTLNPSLIPTRNPTLDPTILITLERDNEMQTMTEQVSTSPTATPSEISLTSTTSTPSASQTSPLNSADPNSFLVDLIGWANADSDPTPSIAHNNDRPVGQANFDAFSISEITLPVLEDATISYERPTLNFGGNTALAVDGGAESQNSSSQSGTPLRDGLGEKFDTLLKFDISMIDRSRLLDSAILRIYSLEDCVNGGTFATTTDASWNQDSVTWDRSPSSDGCLIGALRQLQSDSWYELDMMSAISCLDTLSNGNGYDSVLSVRITSTSNSRCMFSSIESGRSKSPYISVKYAHEGSGMSETDLVESDTLEGLEAPMSGQFILVQTTGDATLDASSPNSKTGSESTLRVAFDSSSRVILDFIVRFDLSELVGITPKAAILSLYSELDCDSAGTIMSTAGDSDWSEANVSWTNAPSYQHGARGGGFKVGTFGKVRSNKWYGFDVVGAVQQAVLENKGAITFRVSSKSEQECIFTSREGGRNPKLMVAF